MQVTLIYPDQLFYNNPALSKKRKTYIIQDPKYFGNKGQLIRFHKQKLLLHLLSIDKYNSSLTKRGFHSIVVKRGKLNSKDYIETFFRQYNITSIFLCYINNHELEKSINNAANNCKVNVNWYDSPAFLSTRAQIEKDFPEKRKYMMANYYKKQRRRFDVLIEENGKPKGGKWSFDLENRKKLPEKIKIPKLKIFDYPQKLFSDSVCIVNKNYNKNPGNLDSFNYPIDREQALNSFEDFLCNRFFLFGDYEDAISANDSVLFHSKLTSYLNIGLITPSEVVNMTMEYVKDHKIAINCIEGFLRQIIGWREFIRGIYQSCGVEQKTTNYWNFNKKIPDEFYNGKTGILPVDNTINKINKFAYCHHIERLMIIGNIMVLLNFDPNQVYKWFMELFIDSYEWVMVPNIYGMSQYSDGGLMSTKPYISGSNYILKMSNYSKGEWTQIWDSLYWNFINKNRNYFLSNPRMSMMVSMYDKKKLENKLAYNKIIKSIKF